MTKTIVAAHGFHAVSIEAVAREAGITRPIVYGHFDDLRGLLEALVERESARALASSTSVLPTALAQGDPRALLLAALRGYLEAVRADPATWRLVLMPPEGAPRRCCASCSRTVAARSSRSSRRPSSPGSGRAARRPTPS